MALLLSDRLAKAGFLHAFPTRDTADAELLAALGAARVVQVKQVHGAAAVLAVEAAGVEADALVAREPGVAVGVRVADCVPVLVADEASGAVAAIHAGWRGVAAGVVRAGVELLGAPEGGPSRGAGAPARPSMLAAIGPCIGACCFEVGADVAERIDASVRRAGDVSAARSVVVRRSGDKAYVDLRAAVRAQLRALGLADDRIEDVAGCTKHEPERFHSFRRDGADSGRMLAAVASRRG